MTKTINVGLIFSRTGSYATVGNVMRAGAMMAISEVNSDPSRRVSLAPVEADPGGDDARYVEHARRMLTGMKIRHVVGCYTSSSRKSVLPLFEKYDSILWYPSHYEGFETNDNVIYTGASPNQHVIPLARFLLAASRRRGFFVGSNYIWAWENNRIMREAMTEAGGAVLGERYVPVGETELAVLIEQILDQHPDFVFCTLIGRSAYTFYHEFRQAARRRGIDQASACPITSCSLAEPELVEIGEAADGHLSSSVYFSTIDTPRNQRFLDAWRARFPELGPPSADAEGTYAAVHLLAEALERAGTQTLEAVRDAASGLRFAAPQGEIQIDSENRHCHMRPRIGCSTREGTFRIVFESDAPVRPDPYLVWEPPLRADHRRPDQQHLRLVR